MQDEELIWFYFDSKEEDQAKAEKGPYALRDLDVLIRTGVINSGTLMFKSELQSWTKLWDIPELKTILLEQSIEIFQLQNHIKNGIERQSSQPPKELVLSPRQSDPMVYNGQFSEISLENEVQPEKHPLLAEIDKFEAEIEELEVNPLNDDEKMEIIKKKIEKNRKKTEKEKQKKKQKWYTPRINTNIYVSGLPPDITDEQMNEFFQKAGVIRLNPLTMKPMIKIYRSEDGTCKGDGLVSYKMVESVSIAREILHEKEILYYNTKYYKHQNRPGYKLSVQEAEFEQKGDYKMRESKRIDKLAKEIAKQKEKILMTWEDEKGAEIHGLKIVILKNMFSPQQGSQPNFFEELEVEIKEELESSVGEVVKMEIFEKHRDGVIKVKFQNSYDADQCIGIMNGRFFDNRQIQCDYWDGKVDYKREADKENTTDELKRLDEFGAWLEEDQGKTEKIEQKQVE